MLRAKTIIMAEEGHSSSEKSLCEPCLEGDVKNNAIGICRDCKEYMCDTCFHHHLKAKPCRNHVLVDIGEISADILQNHDDYDDVEKCKKHDNQVIKYYCRTHEIVGCGDCIMLEHKNCKKEYIKGLTEVDFNQIFENLDLIKSIKKNSEAKLTNNKKYMCELNDKALEAIHQFRLDVRDYQRNAEADIRSKMMELTTENTRQHAELEHDVKSLIKEVEEVKWKLNLDHASKTLYFSHAVTCKPKIENIERKYEKIRRKNALKKFEFVQSTELTQILGSSPRFGKFIDLDESISSRARKWFVTKLRFLAEKVHQRPVRETNLPEYEKVMKEKGLAGVLQKLDKEIDMWKDVKLNLAVTGQTGAGKSSFINAIRDVKATDTDNAAAVGVTETTQACKSFEHPKNPNFLLWDMPGVGSQNFPQSDYKRKVDFDKYDFFIIIGKERFTEYDAWLAQQVLQDERSFFFVRAKIDQDIINEKRDKPASLEVVERKVTNKVREEAKCCLLKLGIQNPQVFLISNCETDKYDFGKLSNKLLASCKGLQKDALALSLAAVTYQIMAEKKRVLEERIEIVALQIAGEKEKDKQRTIFKDEIKFYQTQFSIDERTLAENRELLSLSDEHLNEFEVIFDRDPTRKELQVHTPTASREDTDLFERFTDWFKWTKKNRLLYKYSEIALHDNLDLLYTKARALYEKEMGKKILSDES